jgi:hypothetical protein
MHNANVNPVLFQLGMISVRTFDNMLVFLTAASAEPHRTKALAIREAVI